MLPTHKPAGFVALTGSVKDELAGPRHLARKTLDAMIKDSGTTRADQLEDFMRRKEIFC